MSNQIISQSGAGFMKTGSTMTVGGTIGVFLLENAHLISIVAVLVGLVIGVAGFVMNRVDARRQNQRAAARELREQELHERRLELMKNGGVEL